MRCLVDRRAKVTESPLWDGDAETLYFTDIHGHAIVAYDWRSGAVREIPTGQAVACIGLAGPGTLIAGLESTISLIDVSSGRQEAIASVTHTYAHSRLNDGRCDPAGRFWVGSMKEDLDEAGGILYRVSASGAVHEQEHGLICSNGLAFSPDGRTMYHADSRRSTVWRYDYDPETGAASNRRVFFSTQDGTGRPDGAAVDSQGHYWIARYAGWRVVRHSPDGQERFTLQLPVENPTMCAFAGPDLNTLVITSARGNLTPEALSSQALAGSVLAIDVDVRGLPEPRFAARPSTLT
ncbi:MAG: SMP-30/gluconolactonase/LRE family protein [Bradyrhizobium sp.]